MLRVWFDKYLQSFDGTMITEGSRAGNFSDSWKAKAVVSFITGSFREDDITAGITIIYFLGVAIYFVEDNVELLMHIFVSSYTTRQILPQKRSVIRSNKRHLKERYHLRNM